MKEFDVEEFTTSEDDSDFLGSGTYAKVRRCRHNELGTVVMKCFRLTGSDTAINQPSNHMKNEAEVLCRLKHKNIITVFGVTKWSNQYGIVMEEAAGHNLEDLVLHKKEKDISWSIRLRFLTEIAEGLEYLHHHNPERSYIHGDLKLQNILLNHDLVIKIADFGAVSLLQATGAFTATLEIKPSNQQTWLYSAPELLNIINNPEMKRTCAMDMYSYAMIGYEILTRKQAFLSSGSINPKLLHELIRDQGQKPDIHCFDKIKSAIGDEIDRSICFDLIKIVKQSWKTKAEDRPSAEVVVKNLKATFETAKHIGLYETAHLKRLKTPNNSKQISLNKLDLNADMASNLLRTSTAQLGLLPRLDMVKLTDETKNVEDGFFIPSSKVFVQTEWKGLVGRGNFGKVTLAYVNHLNVVVIKCRLLHGSKEAIVKSRENFIKEVNMLNHANHQNVVRILGYTYWKSSLGIVMEYLPGGNLANLLLTNSSDISKSLKVRFCADISSGVCFLHSSFYKQQLIHGNLNPANVLLTLDLRCKVGGIGGAEYVTRTQNSSCLRPLTDIEYFSVGFIAPERASDPTAVIGKSLDVYSYGAIIYFLLRRCYPNRTFNEFHDVLKRFLKDLDINDPSTELLSRHMKNCCAENPRNRPDMTEVRNEVLNQLRSLNIASITKEVAHIQNSMSIEIPFLAEKDLQVLNELDDNLK